MADFNKVTITEKGQALMTKVMSESRNIKFTSIQVSDTSFKQEQLESLTDIGNVKATVTPRRIEAIDSTTVQVEGIVSNENLKQGYYLRTLGLYAQDPDFGPILYAVASADAAGLLPSYNGKTATGAFIRMLVKIGNADKLEIKINPSAVATIGDLEDLKQELFAKLDTKADASNTYTKSSIDSKLDNKANIDSVYTKPEVDKKTEVTLATKYDFTNHIIGTDLDRPINQTTLVSADVLWPFDEQIINLSKQKADKSDTYSKVEVSNLILDAIKAKANKDDLFVKTVILNDQTTPYLSDGIAYPASGSDSSFTFDKIITLTDAPPTVVGSINKLQLRISGAANRNILWRVINTNNKTGYTWNDLGIDITKLVPALLNSSIHHFNSDNEAQQWSKDNHGIAIVED